MMAVNDELSEGAINKPKHTALHNRLEQKNTVQLWKGRFNIRHASPHHQMLQAKPLARNPAIIRAEKSVHDAVVRVPLTGSHPNSTSSGFDATKLRAVDSPRMLKPTQEASPRPAIACRTEVCDL